MRQRIFSQCQLSVQTLSYSIRTPPCAIAYINVCAHDKDPVVHVRDQWIVETPSLHRRFGSATLFRSWLYLGENNSNFPLEKSQRDNTVVKKEYSKYITMKQTFIPVL